MKIVNIGQSAYDITLPIKGYPKENKKHKINKTHYCGGGSANNMAYLLALWGMDVTLISVVGNDFYGKKIKEELDSVGVNTNYLEEINSHTTVSYIINNTKNGSRTIITNKDSSMYLKKEVKLSFEPDVLLLDGNEENLSLKMIEKYPNALKIIDAGSLKESTVELSKLCDYVICSNDFARDYAQIDFKYDDINQIKEVYQILEKDFRGRVVITLESLGSITRINGEITLVPSIKVKSVDSTGAGDIYHGAFAYFLLHDYSLYDTLRLANIAGALSVTKIGSKDSMPPLEEVLSYHV